MARYYIEQADDRYYDEAELPVAKARARRLSRMRDDDVYIIAEVFDAKRRDYVQAGSIAFYGGAMDAREGICA